MLKGMCLVGVVFMGCGDDGGSAQNDASGSCSWSVTAGVFTTCALRGDGSVWCWGGNSAGQLGDGTTMDGNRPVRVAGITNAVQVKTGTSHSCAVLSDGGLACWGGGTSGEIGDGQMVQRLTPVTVMTSGVAAVAVGDHHTCRLDLDGHIWCWGGGGLGQLGQGADTGSPTPVRISDPTATTTWIDISAGSGHTCAIDSTHAVWCWGVGADGRLGDGVTTDHSNVPVRVVTSSGPLEATHLGLGLVHACAVTSGGVACWGLNDQGQVGVAAGAPQNKAVTVAVAGASQVVGGAKHTCALSPTGVSCWGGNSSGQLGDGTTTMSSVPVSPSSTDVTSLGAGTQHTCVSTGTGVSCWGGNNNGQLGDGTTGSQRLVPGAAGVACSP